VRGTGAEAAFLAGAESADTGGWPLRTYLELAALPTAVPCARLHAKNVLHEWHIGPLADTVELVVSEIVTNAVRASAAVAQHGIGIPTTKVWLTSDGRRVLIQVWDSDSHRPAPQQADLTAESGRGLLLVQTLSAEWGYYTHDGQAGKIVWALCMDSHAPVRAPGHPVGPTLDTRR
jgi:anti-sigma regulatory factor (Ser/Thr protein kinase)